MTDTQRTDAQTPEEDPGSETGSPTRNAVHAMAARLRTAFAGSASERPTNDVECALALQRFLERTGAAHSARRIYEAMPHADSISSVNALRAVLHRLGYISTVETASTANLREEYLPCFVRAENGRFLCIEAIDAHGMAAVFDPSTKSVSHRLPGDIKGIAIFPERASTADQETSDSKQKWSTRAFLTFRPILMTALGLSFITSVTALAVPLFVMMVFDKAIGAKSAYVLLGLVIGVLLIAAADYGLRCVRGRFQAYLGGRLDALINATAFGHLMYMPLSYTDGSPISLQTTRLKQVTSLREAFTGELAAALLDAPFVIIFFVIIAIIGGHLVWIPLALIALYGLVSLWAAPAMQHIMKKAGDARSKLYSLTIEAVSLQQTIRDLACEQVWLRRQRRYSAESAIATMQAQQFQTLMQTLSQSLVAAAGVATLCFGTFMAVDGSLSGGGLIAVMALTWRILSPIRNLFMSTLTIFQTAQSVTQIDRLITIPLERKPNASPMINRTYRGEIVFDRVFFRYPSQAEPTLRSVAFNARPGDVVCLCGAGGSGKSTIMQLLIGLYQQQSGSIFVDGLDLRQLDMGEWRNSLGVMLRKSELFHGTIAQNLRLANPAATDEQLETIADRFGIRQYYNSILENGLNTRYTTTARVTWPDALIKRIALCRAFVLEKPIYLLDDPAHNIDAVGEQAMLSIIEERRGRSTIVMTTHRPSHMKIADTVVWLDAGATRKIGAPGDVLPELLSAA